MRTLYIRHVPDPVAEKLEKLASQAGVPLSTFALQELTETARRADNAELFSAQRPCLGAGLMKGQRVSVSSASDQSPSPEHSRLPARAAFPNCQNI